MIRMKAAKLTLTMALLLVVSFPAKGSEKDLYDFLWLDPDKKVYVLQNKTYKKANSFYTNVGFLKGLSNEYQSTSGIHLSAGYYWSEEWAFEVIYNKYSNSNNDAYKNLQLINQSVPFLRKQDSLVGGVVNYAPFYGKINTFNKIIYFDWSFGLGLGQISTTSNALTVANSATADQYQNESYMGVIGKTGLRIHLTETIHLQVDYLRTMYNAEGPQSSSAPAQKKWRSNSDLLFSVGVSF